MANPTGNKKKDIRRPIITSRGTHITVKGQKDRETYVYWRSIPAMLRLLPENDIRKMGYDYDDPIFQKLLNIKTRKQFTDAFGIGDNQPTLWDKEPEIQSEIDRLSTAQNVMKFKKDVDFSFTQKVLRNGDAHRVKLWKQLYEGWSEKTENVNLNVNLSPADLVREIEARNAEIRAEE